MSTFAGLNTAHLGLNAARRAMETAGQNIANEQTPGYTRQRVEQQSVAAPGVAGVWSNPIAPGGGVQVTGISRTGDSVLDARVRDASASAAYWNARAEVSASVEAGMSEPTEDGLAATLDRFWSSWQDLANTPDSSSAASVVLSEASTLAAQISSGYERIDTQWSQTRDVVSSTVETVNQTATQIAALNAQVRDAVNAGRSPNEFIDARNLLAEDLSRMTGATGTVESDGTLTMRIEGNAIVSGDTARSLTVSGAAGMQDGTPVTVEWSHRAGALGVSGELGGQLATLAPASSGGVLAQAAEAYNDVATRLAETVNAIHEGALTHTGETAGEFFHLATDVPSALGLSVVPSSGGEVGTAAPGGGLFDAQVADQISQLGGKAGGADAVWGDFVVTLGAQVSSDTRAAVVSKSAATAATAAQQSVAAVDRDEETITLMEMQTSYQANARVLTTIDEMLDILINRTGRVGL